MTKHVITLLKPILKDSDHPLWKKIEYTFSHLRPTREMKYSYMDYYNMLRLHIIEGKSWGDIGLSLGMTYNSGNVLLPKRIEGYLKICDDVTQYINTSFRDYATN